MYSLHSLLPQADLTNKKVFLRADLNVPMRNGQILSDFRLKALLPTISLIHEKKGLIILATHLGRPLGIDPNLSTKQLIPWFEQNSFSVVHKTDLSPIDYERFDYKTIILLENLRFFLAEQKSDKNFAKQLAQLANYYVNDAFAVLHRHDTSITLVPQFFATNARTIGLLIERELVHLNKLIEQPKKPYLSILGGGKVSTKLPLIKKMLTKATEIALCPAIVFTFLKAQGYPVGKSLVEPECLNDAAEILTLCQEKNVSLLFPEDYFIARNGLDGQLEVVDHGKIPADGIGISVGPKTVESAQPYAQTAKTIFINCGMAFPDKTKTMLYAKKYFQVIADSPAYKVLGGGESILIAQEAGVLDKFNFVSTGGGATIAYLAGEKFPALEIFLQ